MKKALLLIAFIAFSICASHATHLMGGQITVRQISGLDYEIKMTLYRDTSGIQIATTADFVITDLATSTQVILNAPHNGAQAFINGVELYDYIDTVTFAGPGSYSITRQECCRNGAILNMSNPLSESLHLRTVVTVDAAAANSTPNFLNPPVTLAQKNSLYVYNPLPFDVDGDSIAWSMEIPLGSGGDTVAGYTLPHGASSNPFTLDNVTGEITWMPDSNGHWEASFLVEEFRGGVKTGEIRRDMQIIVVDDTTNWFPMVINTTSWPQDANGHFSINLQANTPFYMHIEATQGDNDQMDLQVQGEPMILAANTAQFSVTSNIPGKIEGDLTWTPTSAQMRTAPYFITVRAFEYHNNYVFTSDRTIMLRVGNATGIKNNGNVISETQIYPNPASSEIFASFTLNASSTFSMEIYDLSGRLVQQSEENFLSSGTHLMNQKIESLSKGSYVVRFMVDKTPSQTLPLIVR